MAKGNHLESISTGSTGVATAISETADQGRSADEIRQDIAAKRESITETVDRLSNRVQQTFDWRTYVSSHPVAALSVAAGLGFLTAGLFKSRPTPAERMKDALAESIEDLSERVRSQMDEVSLRRPAITQTAKAAVTGFLMKAATDFVRNQLSSAMERRSNGHRDAETSDWNSHSSDTGQERYRTPA